MGFDSGMFQISLNVGTSANVVSEADDRFRADIHDAVVGVIVIYKYSYKFNFREV